MTITALTRAAIALAITAGMGGAAFAKDPAPAQPNAQRGKVLFLQCAACHSVDPDGAKKIGPNLRGIVGATAGSRSNFTYSAAFASAKKRGMRWDAKTLDAFIAKPREVVPGNGMTFGGIADPAKRSDIIAYLQSLQQ